MTFIEEYYKWIEANPNKVCKKVKTIYERLVNDIKTPKQVSFFNKVTGEVETHTYIFDEKKVREWIERNMNRYKETGFGL